MAGQHASEARSFWGRETLAAHSLGGWKTQWEVPLMQCLVRAPVVMSDNERESSRQEHTQGRVHTRRQEVWEEVRLGPLQKFTPRAQPTHSVRPVRNPPEDKAPGTNYVPLGSTSYRFYHLKARLPTQGPFRTSINTAAHEKAFDIVRAGSRKPNYSESPLDTGMTLAEVRRRCWRRGRVWKNWMPVHYWLECKVVWQPRETGIFLKVKNIHLLWPRNSNPGY